MPDPFDLTKEQVDDPISSLRSLSVLIRISCDFSPIWSIQYGQQKVKEQIWKVHKHFNKEKNTVRTLLPIILIGIFDATPLSAQDMQGTLKTIQESGKIRIGYCKSLPPMSSLNKDGVPNDCSIDLCNHIVLGVKNKISCDVSIEYILVTAEDRFEALATNRIDILCGATTTTLSRREFVDFTQLILRKVGHAWL